MSQVKMSASHGIFSIKCALALATVLCMIMETVATNPGVKARVTKKGIDYVNSIAQEALNKALSSLHIPDQGGSGHHFEWTFHNIQNRGVTLPASSLGLDPAHHGLAWTISNLGINLHADWRVKYRKNRWIKASTSGSVDVGASGVSASVSISLGKNAAGRPSVSTASCSANIGHISLRFHGGISWLINLFKGDLERKVRDLLTPQICKLITKEVNVDGEAQLATMKVTTEMAHKFLLDYRLTSAPVVTAESLDTPLKGEIYWKADQKEAPFSPPVVPQDTDVSRMLYLWLTDYTANSYAYAAQTHGFLQKNITVADLPAASKSLLNTTCSGGGPCIGKLIPQIGKLVPNATVRMDVRSAVAPTLKVTNGSAVLSAQGTIDMVATTQDHKDVYLLGLEMNVSLTLTGKVVNENLVGQITDHKFKFGVLKTSIGNVNVRGLNIVLNIAMDTVVIPKLNELGQKGVALPVSGDVAMYNTQLSLLEGAILVATDLKYKEDSNILKFISEG